jgi:hypothetical protein
MGLTLVEARIMNVRDFMVTLQIELKASMASTM